MFIVVFFIIRNFKVTSRRRGSSDTRVISESFGFQSENLIIRIKLGVFLWHKPSTLLPTVELVGPPGLIPQDIQSVKFNSFINFVEGNPENNMYYSTLSKEGALIIISRSPFSSRIKANRIIAAMKSIISSASTKKRKL